MKLPTLAEFRFPADGDPRLRVAEHELRRTRGRPRMPGRATLATAPDPWGLEPAVQPAEEGWFVTYLDMMTLLLVVMIVMLAFSGATGSRPGVADAARATAMRVQMQLAAVPVPAADASPIGAATSASGAIPQEPTVIPPPDGQAPYPAAPESAFQVAAAAAATAPLPAIAARLPASPEPDPALRAAADSKASSPVPPDDALRPAVAQAAPPDTASADSVEGARALPPPSAATPAVAQSAQATEGEALAAALPLGDLGKDVEVIIKRRSVSFRINSEILFDTGQESLSGAGLTVLRQAAHLLSGAGYDITVEGHTDSVPVRSSARYPSNWELSSARAGSVVRYLQANGVPRSHLKAVGFADTQPIADNDSVQGRARNRRVELVVSRHRDPALAE